VPDGTQAPGNLNHTARPVAPAGTKANSRMSSRSIFGEGALPIVHDVGIADGTRATAQPFPAPRLFTAVPLAS
jgi:hypothetical protein